MDRKIPVFVSVIVLCLANSSYAQNKFNSRLFYSKPTLYHSKSKVTRLNLSRFDVSVSLPVDNRSKFFGEVIYKDIKARPLDEFFQSSTLIEIQNKIKADLKEFGVGHTRSAPHDKIVIATAVEVFYPKVSGFIRAKSFAKVRLAITATLNDSLLCNNKYESFYITNETDKEFEGDLLMTVEEGTNVTVGMTLRKALDEFYNDLYRNLSPGNWQIVTGKVMNSKTSAGLGAKVLFKSDSSYSAMSTPEGKYRLAVPSLKTYNILVQDSGFVNLSDRLSVAAHDAKKLIVNFRLQPIEVGTMVSLKSILFYTGTTMLLAESYHELDGVVTFLKENAKVKIELDGYTDNRGDAKKDLILSQDRVDRIKAYLVSKGIKSRRITGKGFGSTKPIATNETEDGRKLNRRVEFVILKN